MSELYHTPHHPNEKTTSFNHKNKPCASPAHEDSHGAGAISRRAPRPRRFACRRRISLPSAAITSPWGKQKNMVLCFRIPCLSPSTNAQHNKVPNSYLLTHSLTTAVTPDNETTRNAMTHGAALMWGPSVPQHLGAWGLSPTSRPKTSALAGPRWKRHPSARRKTTKRQKKAMTNGAASIDVDPVEQRPHGAGGLSLAPSRRQQRRRPRWFPTRAAAREASTPRPHPRLIVGCQRQRRRRRYRRRGSVGDVCRRCTRRRPPR